MGPLDDVAQEIDIHTVKIEDLTFRSPFEIVFNRSDFAHAIVGYFDIFFTKGHKTLSFSTGGGGRFPWWWLTPSCLLSHPALMMSTLCVVVLRVAGPQAKYTHWKQTVFYLQEQLTVDAGDKVWRHLPFSPLYVFACIETA